MYHDMMHYKFRLMLKVLLTVSIVCLRLFCQIRNKLDRTGGSVSAVMADSKFIEWETDRFKRMMKAARNWNGHGGISDIWQDSKPSTPKKLSPSKKVTPSKTASPSKLRNGAQPSSNSPASKSPSGSEKSSESKTPTQKTFDRLLV